MSDSCSTLTPKTLELFLYIAGEARHWDWTPPLEGLKPFSREDKGRLLQLKKRGLLLVEEVDPDNHQILFTQSGASLAGQHGVEFK